MYDKEIKLEKKWVKISGYSKKKENRRKKVLVLVLGLKKNGIGTPLVCAICAIVK